MFPLIVFFVCIPTLYLVRRRILASSSKQPEMRPPHATQTRAGVQRAVQGSDTHPTVLFFEDLFVRFANSLPDGFSHKDPHKLVTFLSSLDADALRAISLPDIAHIPSVEACLSNYRFGRFGGRYAPELQTEALAGLRRTFKATIKDVEFWKDFVASGFIKPTPLHLAEDLTKHVGGARIWLKREDQNKHASHKTRTIVAQILLAKRAGMTEIVMDTGFAGHASVAAEFCTSLEMKCTVFIGKDDADIQGEGIRSLRDLGAEVFTSDMCLGCRSLRAAINDAHRYMASRMDTAYYILSGPIGPHPLPLVHRTFQALLGEEVKEQCAQQMGKSPNVLIAPVGLGSGAVGLFAPFLENLSVRCYAVQPINAAPVSPAAAIGVLFGCATYLLQDEHGLILNSAALAPDLNTSLVGPELAWWKHAKGVWFDEVVDEDVLEAVRLFSDFEGFVPSMETAHALVKAVEVAKDLGAGYDLVVLVSGKPSE